MSDRLCAVAWISTFLVSLSCGAEPPPRVISGQVAVWANPSNANLRIQSGAHWPRDGHDSRANPSGTFEVDWKARTVRAYLDVDGDGTLDHYREPAADCSRERDSWQCDLRPMSVTVHRVQVFEAHGVPVANLLSVVGEAYLDDGSLDPTARVCLDGPVPSCSEAVPNPYARTGAFQALSPCQLEATAEAGAHLALELRRGDTSIPMPVNAPPSTEIEARLERRGDSVEVRANVSPSTTHALAWIGSDDASVVLWDTEQYPAAMRLAGGDLLVKIPVAVLDACSDCKAMVQVATMRSTEHVRVIAEARLVVARKGAP